MGLKFDLPVKFTELEFFVFESEIMVIWLFAFSTDDDLPLKIREGNIYFSGFNA